MDEFPEKRKFDQQNEHVSEKKQATDDNRPVKEGDEAGAAAITVNMQCPHAKVGALIGRKGVIIQEIMKRSGCKLAIEQNIPDGVPRQIQLTGSPKELSVAMSLVSQVIENGPSAILPQEAPSQTRDGDFTSDEEMLCPQQKVGAVIGYRGSNVAEILKRTGCRVQIIQDNVPDGVDRKITFSGTPHQIEDAKKLVQILLDEGPTALVPLPSQSGGEGRSDGHSHHNPHHRGSSNEPITQESDIQPEKVKLVIGSKGVTIGQIMKHSGCRVVINQNFPPGHNHKVVYTGNSQQIEIAKYLVETVVDYGMPALNNILNGHDRIIVQEMSYYHNQMVRLLGPQGMNVNDIQMRCGVKINIDYASSTVNKITIVGKYDNVHEAAKWLYHYAGSLPIEGAMGGHHGNNTNNHHSPRGGGFDSGRHGVGGGFDRHHGSNHHHGGSSSGYGGFNNSHNVPVAPTVYTPPPAGAMALGEDGNAGRLDPPVTLPDGSHQQIAEIKSPFVGRVVGKQSVNLSLIKNKSGCNVTLMKPDHIKQTTSVVLNGLPQCVSLASQMIQEVIINGNAKLQQMADVPIAPGLPAPNMMYTNNNVSSGIPSPSFNNSGYGGSRHNNNTSGGGGYNGGPRDNNKYPPRK